MTTRAKLIDQVERVALDRLITATDRMLDRLWAGFSDTELAELVTALSARGRPLTEAQAGLVVRFETRLGEQMDISMMTPTERREFARRYGLAEWAMEAMTATADPAVSYAADLSARYGVTVTPDMARAVLGGGEHGHNGHNGEA